MNIKGLLAMAGMGLALSFGVAKVEAQAAGGGGGGGFGGGGGRNFDPAQFRQMIMDNMREQLEVTNDAEWKVIGDQVQKVFDAQREQGFGGGLNMMRMLRRNNNNNGQGGGNAQGGGRRASGLATAFGADIPDPEGEALQSAIDRNASEAELKAAIAKVAAVRKQKQVKLDQARSGLRDLLTPRQEAIAVTLGLL
jgi:hypothetical protein